MIPKEILKKVKRIEISTRGLVNELFSGEYHSVFKGRGMDFSEVRDYQIGDDIRSIDWNVTARTGHPFVKIFREERELTVMLLVDASGSGDFGSLDLAKGEIAVEICALLAFSAIKNNDKVGLIIFTDRVEEFIPPRKGRKHVLRVLRELLYFRPRNKGTDIAAVLEYLSRVQRRRSVTFLVSDFLGRDFSKQLRVAGRKHDLIAIRITDPREEELPRVGLLELEDAESGEHVVVNTSDPKVQALFRREVRQRQETLNRLLRGIGIDRIDIRTDHNYVQPLIRFFEQRAGRLR
jgi:uncharacterized protein (DUF58 family)